MDNIRYILTPQMKEYDKVGQTWIPYLMYFHTPCYSSAVLNTDSRGFRITYKGSDRIEDFRNISKIPACLLVGGSFAFGVGATNDKNTIPSIMNDSTNYLWLNFGGRAFSSTQEMLLFLFYYQQIKNIKKIVILSGLNNLVLYYISRQYQKETGAFIFQNEYNKRMNAMRLSKKRKVMEFVLKPFFGNTIDYPHVSIEELKRRLLTKNTRECNIKSTLNVLKTANKEELLYVLERDIVNWKIFTKALGIEFYYVLQPAAEWIKKKKSKEEDSLFAALDRLQGDQWKILKNRINYDCYLWFSSKVQEICIGQNVNFFDMNSLLSDMHLDEEWLFVDRAHCTDKGYSLISKILCERVI